MGLTYPYRDVHSAAFPSGSVGMYISLNTFGELPL